MRVVIAPDSFKGSIMSNRAVQIIADAIRTVFPDAETIPFPIADGGEGTVEGLMTIFQGKRIPIIADDPLRRPIETFYGWVQQEQLAIIETAAASGLPLLTEKERNPSLASSYGTGQLICDALERGAKKIVLGLGGSATVDAGTGILQALGVQFIDQEGKELQTGEDILGKVADIRLSGLHPRLREVEFILASDVQNPLLGPEGAVYVFGPQKGVGKDELQSFEANMAHYARVLCNTVKRDERDTPGSGAAGGIGFSLLSVLDAHIESGFELISRWGNLEEKISTADLVITGEGKFDFQSLYGKVPVGVAELAKKYQVPVVVFTGKAEGGLIDLPEQGIHLICPIVDQNMSLSEAMAQGEALLERAVIRFCKSLQMARELYMPSPE
ncbi:glycerate kinase [Paenactinomyces guangxiensis]|uniref:Glycerate kinase n=1 Tax=Paenactinomyces guangxiensis TaxID=1490290 RepID=A0A7W2A7H4_9BACL|nr:glycerate kinase [Paenactinomyces guangxiensis]MBA4494566.1 glycerate kinase [Paenactinomyces guangxiensis]MBH8591671.1 glycerate kinase [Paenactinomyces guangxiensis]